MAFEKKEIDPRGFLFLVLLALPRIAATNIDCNGRPFHCVNSTHFMICVDLGGGLSSTIDDFILPCPEPTICHTNNRYECEFPPVNPSTQLGSLHATNATAIESGITTESTLTTVSTTWDATLSEATINTLSPTTSNGFRNATIIDMNNSPIDQNNTTVLSVETTTEMFTLGINITPTSNDILNITNTIVIESTTTPIFINDTDLTPSTISTDLLTESLMSTLASTASTDNLVASNINTGEHITSKDLNMTSPLPTEITTEILIEGIASTIATTTNDILNTSITSANNLGETTNSINTNESISTTKDQTKSVIATVSPTSGNDLSSWSTVETVLTTDANATTVFAPETTTETTIKGIESALVPTANDVTVAAIATTNDLKLTTDAVKTTDLPLSTTHDASTKPIITTYTPTISGDNLSTSNMITVDAVITIEPNVTSTLPPEATTEILNEGIANTSATTTNNIQNITITTVNHLNETTDAFHITDLPLSTTYDTSTKPIITTFKPTLSGDNLSTSNTITADAVITIEPNVTSALPPEATAEILNEGIRSTIATTSTDILNITITTVKNLNETTNSINTTELSISTTKDEWTKPLVVTVSPTSINDLSTSNTVETELTTDANATTVLVPETITETTIKGIESALVPTSNDVPNATVATANDPKLTTGAVKTTDLPLSATHDSWIKPITTTFRPTRSADNLSTLNTITVDAVITTELNVTSALPPEATTEILNERIASTIASTTNDILNITITTINNLNETTDAVNITDLPLSTTRDASIKPIITTFKSAISGDNLSTSNMITVDVLITIEPNVTSTLPPEATAEILNEEIASTSATTTNNILNITNTAVNHLNETTNSINTTDLPISTTNDDWRKPVTATVIPTSGNNLFTSSTVNTVLTTDPNATTELAPETTTETNIKGIESTLVPTSNDVSNATITTVNDLKLTTDAVKTSNLLLSTTHDTWTKPLITTFKPTISGEKLSVSNTSTLDAIVTTYSNVTSVLPPEVTTEILNDGIASTIATTSNGILNTTVTTPNDFNVSKVVVNTTDLALMILNDGWTKPIIATIKPISGNDLSTSNTVESVLITDPNTISTLAPKATTKTSNKGIENTLDSTSSDVLNATSTTVSEPKLTTDAVKTTDLPLNTTHDAWPKVLTSKTSSDYLFTANTNVVEVELTTDLNVITLLESEITSGTSIKIIGDTIAPTSNDVLNLNNSSVNYPKLAPDSVNVINSFLMTTNEAWTKPLISTPISSKNSDNLSTSNTETVQSAVITDLNVNSTPASEITTDTSIKAISSSLDSTSSDVRNATSTTLNNIKVTTASFHITEIAPKSSNETEINSILSTLNSTINSDESPISTFTTVSPLITADSNVTSILSQEATTAISIKEIAFTDISTYNDLVTTTTIAYESKLTTDETIASLLPSQITNPVGMTLTNPTVSPTKINENLHIPIIDIVGKPITTDSDISSVLPPKIPTEFLTLEIVSTAGPTFNDNLNMTDATIPNINVATDSLNAADLPLTTMNVSRTKPIMSSFSSNHTGRLITSSKYVHSPDKDIDVPAETTDSYTTLIFPPATEILLSIENKTTDTFTVNATKSSFTVKPEAEPTYRESQANAIEENSSTIHDSDNRDFVTTTSTDVEAFTLKNEDSIPKEPRNKKKLPIFSSLKQYNTETGFITEFHQSTVDPGTIKTILGSTISTQYINFIEKRTDSTDKLPTPYLSHTSPQNNKVNATTITDFGNINKSNLRDISILINLSTPIFLVTTDNPQIKLSTKHEEPTIIGLLLNVTRNNSSHANNYNAKSALNIYDSVDSGVTLHGNNRGNSNVPIHSKTENNRKQSRNANDTTESAIKWNSAPNILISYGNINTVIFDCAYHNRGRYAENNDCRKFYICIGRRQPIIGTCPINTVFSEIWKQCTKNLSHCVRNNQFRCISEGRFSDVLQHNIYYICIKNDANSFYRFKLQCQNGYHLNKTIIKCIPNADEPSQSLSVDSDSSSKTSDIQSSTTVTEESEKSTKSDFECTESGVYADPNDCRRYYLCTKNKSQYRRKKKKCDSDEVFHREKKKCVDADSYEC